MCLIVVALDPRPDLPLLIAGNRDEFYARPTLTAAPWPDAPQIIAGRDLQAGGTWLGITRAGRWAAVTNYREAGRYNTDAPSRGDLVSDFLRGEMSTGDYLSDLAPGAARYNGFNLLVGDRDCVRWFSNRGEGHPLLGTPLPAGIYGLSNHLLDTPWPKVERAREEMVRVLESGADPDTSMGILLDRTLAADAELPHTGIPTTRERALSAIFIEGPEYGTRCSTVIHGDASGHYTLVERSFQPPSSFSTVRHEFDIET